MIIKVPDHDGTDSWGIVGANWEIICDRSFSPPTYSYGSPLSILDLAHIEQGVLRCYFRVGVVAL